MKRMLLVIPAMVAGLAVLAQSVELSPEEAQEIMEEVKETVSANSEEGEIINVGTPQVVEEEVIEVVTRPSSNRIMPVPVRVEEDDDIEGAEEEVFVGSSSSSLDDIINIQQQITVNMSEEKHFQSVWSKKGYFNISYNMAKLEPKEVIHTGLGTDVPNLKCDWGVGLQYGRNYSLLKHPIANIVMINLDYTPLDLNVNHYKKAEGKYLYNSAEKNGDKFYLPWNVEKFEYNYGMNLGPSITVAPFTKLNVKGLHFIKLNIYYHIGYHVSLLQFNAKDDQDANPDHSNNSASPFKTMKESLKLAFGHWLTNCVGANLSWKAIGVGYEVRWASLKYMSLDKKNFGSDKYKFNAPTARVYLDIRL